jgi:hypothetical protein
MCEVLVLAHGFSRERPQHMRVALARQ